MKNKLKIFLLLVLIPALLSCEKRPSNLQSNSYFYPTSKPNTRYWWFASIMKKDDIRHQLNWAKEKNFGGVEIAWVYPVNRRRYTNERETNKTPINRQEWLSPAWTEIVAFTKQYCDSIGLSCDFTFGTGWPFGDTHVKYDHATCRYNEKDESYKETYVTVSWEYPQKGYIINHLDKAAFEAYAQRLGKALQPALQGSRSALFCDSWEVPTRRIWTHGFAHTFKQIYGYDITRFMDNIYDRKYADEYYDYMKLVSDYVINRFYRPFTEFCHANNAVSRVQICGAPVDLLTANASVDIPESEAMLYEPKYAQIPASAACLSGKREITSETFTCIYGFPKRDKKGKTVDFKHRGEEQTADLKLVADALFANGVNQIIWHGMPHNPVGVDSIMFYATVHVGSRGKLAKELAPFNRYMQKVSAFMKKGTTYSDIAVYIPQEDAWEGQEMRHPDPQQPWAWGEYEMRTVNFPAELKGYRPLWVNHDFLKKATFVNGLLKIGDVSFSSLYIDVDFVDDAALTTILNLARKGLSICLKKDFAQPGYMKDATYAQRFTELKSLQNVRADFSATAVKKPLVHGEGLPDFWCRVDLGNYYIFFANPKAQNLHLPLQYGQGLQKEAIIRNVVVATPGKTQEVQLKFEPYQSLLLKIDRKGKIEFEDIYFRPEDPDADTSVVSKITKNDINL